MIARPNRLLSVALICLTALVAGPLAATPVELAGKSATPPPLAKAALLYNFTRFTDWPAGVFSGGAAALVICVLGDDAVAGALESLAGEKIRGRRLTVRRVTNSRAAVGCHLLFIGVAEQRNLAVLFAALGEAPVLTIAERPDFARIGGIICLKTHSDGRIGFEINLGNANRVGLKLSSKLLDLAELAPN